MARGDDEFVEFARASSRRLMHAAYLLTGDRHQAEDAVQTVYARVYAAWSRVRRQDAYAYARATLVNHVNDRWRRPLRELAAERLPERVSPDGDVAERVAQRRWAVEALALLTARERSVVVLRHFFDLSEAEVAAELNITVGTVKSTNARALGKLRITEDPRTPGTTGGMGTDGRDTSGRDTDGQGASGQGANGRGGGQPVCRPRPARPETALRGAER